MSNNKSQFRTNAWHSSAVSCVPEPNASIHSKPQRCRSIAFCATERKVSRSADVDEIKTRGILTTLPFPSERVTLRSLKRQEVLARANHTRQQSQMHGTEPLCSFAAVRKSSACPE